MSKPKETGMTDMEESGPEGGKNKTFKKGTIKGGKELKMARKKGPTNGKEVNRESKLGDKFLQIANQFESINNDQIKRKRKPRKKKQMVMKIAIEPNYGGDELRSHQNKRFTKSNEEKLEEKRKRTLHLNEEKSNEKLEWIGDKMIFDDEWPNTKKDGTMRIFTINMNGVTYQNKLLEWEISIAFLMDMQIDIFGLTEINLDLDNRIVRDEFAQRVKHFDKYMKLAVSASKQKVGKTSFKMGGTATGVNGGWSGRMQKSGSDKLGRWSYITLRAKQGKMINIITCYVPRKTTNKGAETTIYSQMELDLLQNRKKLLNPRKELIKDLKKVIIEENKKGNATILMGDMNDDMGKEKGEIRKFLEECNMEMTHLTRHGENSKLPATHDRGSTCIDMIAHTKNIPSKAIKRTGFAPFYTNFYTDHRGLYVDLDTEMIFAKTNPDTTKSTYKRFTTTNVKKCSKYLKKLEELFEEARIFKTVDKLEMELIKHRDRQKGVRKIEEIVLDCQTVSNKVKQLMICSERTSGPTPYKDGFPASPQIREKAFQMIRLKKYLRLSSLGLINTTDEEKEIIHKDIKKAQIELREAQKYSHQLRNEYLHDLAEKRSFQWNMTTEEALHIIIESENSTNLHKKHRRFMKAEQLGTLRSLLVPKPVTGRVNNLKDPKMYTEVTDTEMINNLLLQRNYKHLLLSKSSMFARGDLLDKVGWYGEQDGINELLDGVIDCKKMSKEYPEFGVEGEQFLKALRLPNITNGKNDEPFTWKFGTEEYIETFNHTKESTACGPSGLHMSHWKAACERKRIARVHAFLIWAAFEFGFTYERWGQSWHCMIQKLKHPIIHKLRIVQLFEGDFNAGLKYLIGRKLMQHMNDNGTHDQETFGSRTGKTAPEALLNLQILFEHCRQWEKPVGCMFNDAIGCYDRIVPTLCEIAMIKKGCPRGIAKCHTLTQKNMEHKIRTAAGVSDGCIRFSEQQLQVKANGNIVFIQGLTGGIGQGGGGGPMAWITIIAIMVEAYRKLCSGAEATDVTNIYTMMYWIISYVDDNTLVTNFRNNETNEEIIRKMTGNLRSWQRLLQITGGDIDIDKSQWCLLKWKYNEWGQPKLVSKKESRLDITLNSPIAATKQEASLQRLDPWEADRVLGVRLPMDGTMKIEYRYRLEQIKTFADKMMNSPLTHYDAYIVYECRYRSMIKYPLPVTTFTTEQCNMIQKPFMAKLLPKMGLNRNMPRAIIYGPRELGGRELMDLRIEQQVIQWETTRGHLRRMDRVGQGLMLTLNDHQSIIGSETPFLQLNPNEYDYGEKNTRWKYLWKMMWKAELKAEICNQWMPSRIRNNDINIMDRATKDPILQESKWPLLDHVNRCRLYLQVFFLSELSNDGKSVDRGFLDGTRRNKHPTLNIPEIEKPTTQQWRIWKEFIFRNFLSPGVLINPPLETGMLGETENVRQRDSEEIQVRLLYGSSSLGLQEILDKFPDKLKTIMGDIEIPEDDGLKISESIVEGTCLAASDGGMKNTFLEVKGGHGYTIGEKVSMKNLIKGKGACPMSDRMSSQTAEHYGLIGLLCTLHALCIKYQLTQEECFGEVIALVDNKNVVKRMEKGQDPFNIRDYSVPDYDLWTLSTRLLQQLPIKVRCKWIRAHQNENSMGKKLNGPFSREVELNIVADDLATTGLHQANNDRIKKPIFHATRIGLKTAEGKDVEDLRKYLLKRTNGDDILNYYRERRGWDRDIIQTIDWEAVDNLLRKTTPLQKNRLMQMMHNWQNVGAQKGKMRDSRLGKNLIPPPQLTMEETDIHLCPNGCGENEENMHYVRCQDDKFKKQRDSLRREMIVKLKKARTEDNIVSIMNYIVKKISNDNTIDIEEKDLSEREVTNLRRAIVGQDKIGWKAMLQGFVHEAWAIEQDKYFRRMGWNKRTHNKQGWRQKLLQALTEYTKACWKMRNESIHGDNKKEGRTIRLKLLQGQVEKLYKRKRELNGKQARLLYAIPLVKRLKYGVQALTLWIGKVEEVLKLNREQAEKYTIRRWLG